MLDRLKKIVLSASIVVLFALYAIEQRAQSSANPSDADAFVADVPPAATATVTTPALIGAAEPPPPTPSATATATATAVVKRSTSSANTAALGERPTATATQRPQAPTPTPAPASNGLYADGSYSGSVADAHWGDVQVQVLIQDGLIADVRFLTYPDHRSRSRSINDRAMPILIQEALESQKARVDIVTGATDTSEAFIESLAAALREARA